MVIRVQVLSTNSTELSPSLLVSSDEERLLFDVGDGIQRLCMEHRIRLSKLGHIFLTQLNPNTLGGLPGMIMTVSDTCDKTCLKVYGPPNTKKYLHATRHFLQRPNMDIEATDIEMQTRELNKSSTSSISGKSIMVHAVPICSRPNLHQSKRKFSDLDGTTEKNRSGTSKLESNGSIAITYIIETPPQRGKFLVDIATSLGVPKGKLFGRLHSGESVTLTNGKVIHPKDCVSPSIAGGLCLIVSCPGVQYIDNLIHSPELQRYQKQEDSIYTESENAKPEANVLVIYHLAADDVLRHPQYITWISRFHTGVHHVLLNHHACPIKSVYRASSKMQHQLHSMFPLNFPSNEYEQGDLSFVNVLKWSEALGECGRQLDGSVVIGESMLRYALSPLSHRGFDRSDCFRCLSPVLSKESAMNDELRTAQNLNVDFQIPSIIFLGTGCAIPSKFRNVTGIYLSLNPEETNNSDGRPNSMLLDCGEGSLGQLYRAASGTSELFIKYVRRLQCVWISHNHADHHLGLLRVLYYRVQIGLNNPILIIGPTQICYWLEEYAAVDPSIANSYRFVDNRCFSTKDVEFENFQELRDQSICLLRRTLSISHLEAVPVKHAQHSYGVVLDYTGGTRNCRAQDAGKSSLKLAFSGDCRPSEQLAMMAEGAYLLIHEATFEDGMESEAKEKCHCTITQAIQIGQKARAEHVILTHFSQRYPKTAVVDDSMDVLTAFDLLSLPLEKLQQTDMMKACNQLLAGEADI